MIAQLRSELRKMATTRTNLGLLLGLVALILFGVIAGSFGSEADLSLAKNQRELIGNGTFAAVFAALIGVMAMTSEFRHGTICATSSSRLHAREWSPQKSLPASSSESASVRSAPASRSVPARR